MSEVYGHCVVQCTGMNIHYNEAALLMSHVTASSVTLMNTVIYQLVVQITLKLCIDLEDKRGRETIYGKLPRFIAVHLECI